VHVWVRKYVHEGLSNNEPTYYLISICQGDEERSLGIPVTAMPQCDRGKACVPAGQKSFIQFIVKPTFDALSDFADAVIRATKGMGNAQGLRYATETVKSNLAFWDEARQMMHRYAFLNT